MVAGTLLPNRTLDIHARVMNPTTHEIQLKKGVHCQVEDAVVIERESPKAPTSGCSAVTEVYGETSDVGEEPVLQPLWTYIAEDVLGEIRERLRALILSNRKAFSFSSGTCDSLTSCSMK